MTTQSSTIARQAEAAGASPQFAYAYLALHAAAAQQPAVLTGDVEPILGRPATLFAQRVDNRRDLVNND
jgi:hypothetical protein